MSRGCASAIRPSLTAYPVEKGSGLIVGENAFTRAGDEEMYAHLDPEIKQIHVTPEATRPFIDTELPALAMHIFCEGVKNSPRAGLTRGLVGVTSRDETAALIINAPGSVGGVTDTITVIGPLLPSIFEQLGKHI